MTSSDALERRPHFIKFYRMYNAIYKRHYLLPFCLHLLLHLTTVIGDACTEGARRSTNNHYCLYRLWELIYAT